MPMFKNIVLGTFFTLVEIAVRHPLVFVKIIKRLLFTAFETRFHGEPYMT